MIQKSVSLKYEPTSEPLHIVRGTGEKGADRLLALYVIPKPPDGPQAVPRRFLAREFID